MHLNGVEVAGLTVDRKIRFDSRQTLITYGLWWQGDKRRLRASGCLCRVGLGTLKTPSCPWRWVTGSRSKFWNWTTVHVSSLHSWHIAECDVYPQPTNQPTNQPIYNLCWAIIHSIYWHIRITSSLRFLMNVIFSLVPVNHRIEISIHFLIRQTF